MRLLSLSTLTGSILLTAFATPVTEYEQYHPKPPVKPSPPKPVTIRGKIQCSNADSLEDLGFLGVVQNIGGEYHRLQKNLSASLSVSFSYKGVKGQDFYSQLDLKILPEGPHPFPYVAGHVSFSGVSDGIGTGVYSTGIFVGSGGTTPKGSTPVNGSTTIPSNDILQPKFETAIWSYRPSTRALGVRWVNPDRSSTEAVLVTYNEKFGFTGDAARLRVSYNVVPLACKIAPL